MEQTLFGERLNIVLKRLGVSQSELTRRAGLHGSALNKVIHSHRKPPLSERFYQELAQLPGITTADFEWVMAAPNAPVRTVQLLKRKPRFVIFTGEVDNQGLTLTYTVGIEIDNPLLQDREVLPELIQLAAQYCLSQALLIRCAAKLSPEG